MNISLNKTVQIWSLCDVLCIEGTLSVVIVFFIHFGEDCKMKHNMHDTSLHT